MATTKKMTPGREGYKILFNENTVIMNYKFAAAAAKYGTPENKLMKDIRTDFPGMAEIVISGREQTSAKKNTRLTYENMETHIKVYENADELMEVFESVKARCPETATPILLTQRPILGAAVEALFEAGVEDTQTFRDTFTREYQCIVSTNEKNAVL